MQSCSISAWAAGAPRSASGHPITRRSACCGPPAGGHASGLLPRLPTLSPHRVFVSRLGRIEVYQPIPVPTGKTPDGPHTHVLQRLLARGRSHAATIPIPAAWVVAMTLYPPHPLRQSSGRPIAFDPAKHEAFQGLMERYGAPALMAGKQAAARDEKVETREESLGHRIGLRQQRWLQAHRPA